MLPPGLTLEPARRADFRAIVELRRAAVLAQAGACYGPAQIDGWLAHPLDELAAAIDGGGGVVLVARAAASLAGVGWASAGPRAHLRSLYVAPDAMRQGIGSALLAAAEHAMRLQGVPVLWLAATLNARPFYLRRGYAVRADFSWQPPARPADAALRLCSMNKRLPCPRPPAAVTASA